MNVARLQVANVRCLPSIHGRAVFAALAEAEIDRWKPDVVAVEIPAAAAAAFRAGVRALPQIRAVCLEAAGPRRRVGLIALDPADSIVAGARRALNTGVRVECIDLFVNGIDLSPRPVWAPDERLVEHLGLDRYYGLWLARGAGRERVDRTSLRRERSMAHALTALARRHRRVLAILGMAHWERVKRLVRKHLSGPPRRPPREAAGRPQVHLVDVHPRALRHVLRQPPFCAWDYERRRGSGGRFSAAATLAALVVEAQRDPEPAVSVRQLGRLGLLVRRLAGCRHRLTPNLYEILVAARGIVGREFARHVLWTAMSFPQAPPDGQRPVLDVAAGAPRLGVPLHDGRRQWLDLELPWARGEERERLSELLEEIGGDEDLRRPAGRGFRLFVTRRDENEREDRVARLIVGRVAAARERALRSREFRRGLRGGLDVRRTARDAPAAGRIFVREPPHRRRPDADRFGAVLVAFEDGAGRARGTRRTFAKDCHHTGPKFWKMGCESDRLAVPGSGWLYGRYRALAIVLDTSRPVHEVLGLWHRELAPYPFTLARLARLVCRHAPPDRPLVAFVARRPPGRELRALAAAHGRELVHAETGAMGDLLGTIRGFHRRFDAGPDAE